MAKRGVAERAAFVSAAIGPLAGALFLFAPVQGYRMTSITETARPAGATPGPPATAGPEVCAAEALWQRQEIFPMPFFAVLVWSLAPLVVYLGVRLRLRGQRARGPRSCAREHGARELRCRAVLRSHRVAAARDHDGHRAQGLMMG